MLQIHNSLTGRKETFKPLEPGKATLFLDPPEPSDALWHGPRPSTSVSKGGPAARCASRPRSPGCSW